jgi:hypothetical protein
MILDFVQHPDTGFNYIVPRNQVALTFPSERRSGTIPVPGANGGFDPYGRGPLPRAVGEITYRFRVTPHDDRQSFTEARDAFVRSVSHGKRQTLGFITDAGDYRVVQAKILRKPLQVDINAPFWADFEVAWEVTDPILAAPNPPGVVTWGPQQHWGDPGLKWGANPYSYALAVASVSINIDNATTGATAETTDMKFALSGPFGPAPDGGGNLINGTYIEFRCLETGMAFGFLGTLGAGESAMIDLGGRSVTKNGQPAFGSIFRPAGQPVYLSFAPNVTNTLVVTVIGTARTPLSGRLVLTWLPKYEP